MAIIDDVSSQMKDAMRARDKGRLTALRGIRAAFIEALKADGSTTLADEQAHKVLRRLARQRTDSIESYVAADRQDLADIERLELAVIETFLPQQADEATTIAWIQEAIASCGATSPSDMGKVMGAVMRAHKGDIDGRLAKTVALRLLQG